MRLNLARESSADLLIFGIGLLQSPFPSLSCREDGACLFFNRRALEEMRIVGRPQPHRIGEDEVAEVSISDQSFLDQFVCFVQYSSHILNIEMTNVRSKNRAESCIERIGLRVECPCIDRVVGFAAEVEASDEQFADILRMLDPAGDEIVERSLGIGSSRRQASARVSEKLGLVSNIFASVFAE